jgi:hypothetical protein
MSTAPVDPKAVSKGKELSLELALDGLNASPPAAASFMIGAVSFTLPTLIAKLQSLLGPYDQKRSLETQLAAVRASLVAQNQEVMQFMRDFRLCFRGMLGAENDQLTTYGVKPLEPRPELTGPQRVQMAQRAKATRQKNGTLGKKQKAELDSKKEAGS